MDGRNLVSRGFETVGENLRRFLHRDTSDSTANRKTGARFTVSAAAFISLGVYEGYFNDNLDPAQVTEQGQLNNDAN